MSTSDQQRRERLWIALSDLFLDTETRWFLPYAAARAVEDGFRWSEVRQILEYELTPVLGSNLLDIAGEWAGFPEDWLLGQLRARQAEGAPGLLAQAGAVIIGTFNRPIYQALEKLHRYFVSQPAHLRPEEEQRLCALARLCLEPIWTARSGYWTWTNQLSLFPPHRVEMTMRKGIEPAYLPLLVHPGDATPTELEQNWRLCRELLDWLHSQDGPQSNQLKVLEELSMLFTVENLAQVPRGPMVLSALQTLQVSPHTAEQLFRGPLTRLYGHSARAERNWHALFQSDSLGA